MKRKNEKKKKNRKWYALFFAPSVLIAIAAITATAAMTVAIVYVVEKNDDTSAQAVLAPNSVPSNDEGAIKVEDETSKLTSPEGGGSVSLEYSDKINVNLASNKAEIYFKNPAESNQNMVLQVIITNGDKEYLVAQSDKLEAGYLLQSIKLEDDIKSLLQEGIYKGKYNVLYFHPKTGERAIINTNIPVDITVAK